MEWLGPEFQVKYKIKGTSDKPHQLLPFFKCSIEF